MTVDLLAQLPAEVRAQCDDFVASQPGAVDYHRPAWAQFFCEIYGYAEKTLVSRGPDGAVRGILPLCLGRRLGGARGLSSLPHASYAGILGDGEEARRELLDAAVRLADELRVEALEIRQFDRMEDPRLVVQDHKVHFDVDLTGGIPAMWKTIRNNLRWEIKQGYKRGLVTKIGGVEYLDTFYSIYERLERGLGIPGHPKAYFEEVWRRFGPRCRFFTTYLNGEVAGSILALCHDDRIELVWGGTLEEHKASGSTPMIFWRAACWAQRQGLRSADFGRSTVGSGVYLFKKKWASPERPLYYHYYLRKGGPPPAFETTNAKYRLAIATWQKMPLAFTRTVGGRLMRYFF